MQLIFLAMVLVVFHLSWKHVWQPVALGICRDMLFDIRNEFRDWAIREKISLENQQYLECRKFINSCIRYLEHYKFYEYLIRCRTYSDYPDIFERDRKIFKARFVSGKKILNTKIDTTMQKATRAVRFFMVLRNPFLFFLLALFILYEYAKAWCIWLKEGLKNMRPAMEIPAYAMATLLLFLANTSAIMSPKYQDVAVSQAIIKA